MSSPSHDSQCCQCLASRDPSAHVLVVDQGIVPPSPDPPRSRKHTAFPATGAPRSQSALQMQPVCHPGREASSSCRHHDDSNHSNRVLGADSVPVRQELLPLPPFYRWGPWRLEWLEWLSQGHPRAAGGASPHPGLHSVPSRFLSEPFREAARPPVPRRASSPHTHLSLRSPSSVAVGSTGPKTSSLHRFFGS